MTDADTKKQWREYLAANERRGLNLKETKADLLAKGYDRSVVREAIADYAQFKNRKILVPTLATFAIFFLIGTFTVYQPSGPTGFATITSGGLPVITIDYNTAVGSVPPDFYAFHGSAWGGNASLIDANNDGSLEMSSNYQAHRAAMIGSKTNYLRRDMYLNNVINADGTFNRYPWSNGGNIDNAKSMVTWASQNNYKILFETTFMPRWLANNHSTCSYGAVGTSFTSCEPSNYTRWGEIVVAFLEEAGCPDHPGLCEVEVWNEPYLPQFWLTNGTCPQRTAAYSRMYNATYAAIKAAYPDMLVGGPSGYYGISCGVNLTNAFLSSTPTSMIDFVTVHEYGNANLRTLLVSTMNNIRARGHGSNVKITEYGAGTATVEVYQPINHTLYLTDALVSALRLQNISSMVLFEWANDNKWSDGPPHYSEHPLRRSMFAEPALENTIFPPYNVTRDMSTYHSSGNNIVTTTETTTTFVFASKNNTNQTFTIGNRNSAAVTLSVSLSGVQAAAVKDQHTQAVYAVTGGVVNLTIPGFGVRHYTVIAQQTPPPTVNSLPTITTPIVRSIDASNMSTQDIFCTARVTDQESASLVVAKQWYKNGVAFGAPASANHTNGTNASTTISAVSLASGDSWHCGMQAFDGTNYSTWHNASPLIVLSPPPPPPPPPPPQQNQTNNETANNTTTPEMTFPSFGNLQHNAGSGVARYGSVMWSTDISDTNGIWTWMMQSNASETWTAEPSIFAQGMNQVQAQVTKTIFAKGGNTVCATFSATNSQNNTNTSTPSCFTVLHTPPTSIRPSLTTNGASNYTDENLQCSVSLQDIDEDTMNVTVAWYRNGVLNLEDEYNNDYENGSLLVAVLSNTATETGESWECDATISDGNDVVQTARSLALYVLAEPDTQPPTINLTAPIDESTTISTDVNFSWIAYDDSSLTNNCMLTIDGTPHGANQSATSGTVMQQEVPALPSGTHSWQVRCTDDASNTGYSSIQSVTVPKLSQGNQNTNQGSRSNGGGGRVPPRTTEKSSGGGGLGLKTETSEETTIPQFTGDTELLTGSDDSMDQLQAVEDASLETPSTDVIPDKSRAKTLFSVVMLLSLGIIGVWQFVHHRQLQKLLDDEEKNETPTIESGP